MMRMLRIIYICNILFYMFIIENILVLVTIMSTTSNLISQQLTYLWSMLNKSYTDPSPAHMDNAYF